MRDTNWKFGKPTEWGIYLVTLEYPVGEWDAERNEIVNITGYEREVGTRLLDDKRDNWTMFFEPEEDELVWSEQTGSSWHERVIAWMELPEPYNPKGGV